MKYSIFKQIDGAFVIETDYDPQLVSAIHANLRQPNYHPPTRQWLVPPTPRNLAGLRNLAETFNLTLDPQIEYATAADCAEWGRELARRTVQASTALTLAEPLHIPEFNGKLLPFQHSGTAYMVRQKRVLNADDVGLGKTVQSLAGLAYAKAFPALVICPPILKPYWQQHVAQFLPQRTAVTLDGTQPAATLPPADVYIINYDILAHWLDLLRAHNWRSVICDEAHLLGNLLTQRTKTVRALLTGVRYVWLLSGTPAVNDVDDLLNLMDVLDVWHLFGSRKAVLRSLTGSYEDALMELNFMLREHTLLRRTRAQALPELPSQRNSHVWLTLPGLEAYQAYERALAEQALQQPEKARGSVATLRHQLGALKLPTAVEWLQTSLLPNTPKVVVFGYHTDLLRRLANAINAPFLGGETTAHARQRTLTDFQTQPQPRCLVASLNAIAQGIDLTAASHVVFFEIDWAPGRIEQAIGRLHRFGQRNTVQAWFLLAKDTLDAAIWHTLRNKAAETALITDGSNLTISLLNLVLPVTPHKENFEV